MSTNTMEAQNNQAKKMHFGVQLLSKHISMPSEIWALVDEQVTKQIDFGNRVANLDKLLFLMPFVQDYRFMDLKAISKELRIFGLEYSINDGAIFTYVHIMIELLDNNKYNGCCYSFSLPMWTAEDFRCQIIMENPNGLPYYPYMRSTIIVG